jgi:hypothetical protein
MLAAIMAVVSVASIRQRSGKLGRASLGAALVMIGFARVLNVFFFLSHRTN